MQTLSQVMGACQTRDGGLTVEVSEEWLQGRSLYGGLQAALAVEAMRPLSDGLPIRTLQATLCAPVPAGRLRLDSRLLRRGGNTRHVEARIMDGDATLALLIGIFGRSRTSRVGHDLRLPPEAGATGTAMPYIEGRTPVFLQHFDAELVKGHFPGAGQQDLSHVFRVSLKDDAPSAGLPQLLAISDFPPPVGLSWLESFTPGSTMTWMLNFTGHDYIGQPLQDWVIDVTLDSAHDGYTQQTVTLFAPDGFAVARGTQCMVIFG